MISKRILNEELGLNTIEEFFDLIFKEYENGNSEGCKTKFGSLSMKHKKQCIRYFERYDPNFIDVLVNFYTYRAKRGSILSETRNINHDEEGQVDNA